MTKSIKRYISLLLVIVIISQIFTTIVLAEDNKINAHAAFVYDHDTGDTLLSKNGEKMMVPASMTKILTTYIIFEEIEKGNLSKDTMIKVSPKNAALSKNRNYPANVPLIANKSYSVNHFIKLILLPSASASCIVMAEHISGSEEAFARRMNDTMAKFGLQSNFKNSHGAHPHYVSAESIAKLISIFIDKYPEILNYTSIKSMTHEGKTYKNTNGLIQDGNYKYTGADGFKTGTIKSAGHCLSATASRNNRRLISVVMKSNGDYNRHMDSIKALNYGFNKIKVLDQARLNTKYEFINLPDNIRLNSDTNITIKASNVKSNHNISGGLKVNGEIVDSFNNINIKENTILSLKGYTNDNSENTSIEFFINLPNGEVKSIETNLQTSKQEPAKYRDINNNWAEDYINNLSDSNIFKGINNNYFGTGEFVDRAMVITLLGRTVENLNLDSIEGFEESNFKDISQNAYYYKYINWAKSKGIIKGHNNMFEPNRKITREETAVILDRFLKLYACNLQHEEIFNSSDQDLISNWAKTSVSNAYYHKLLSNFEDNNFKPKRNVYRPEMAYMLDSCINIIEEHTREISKPTLNENDENNTSIIDENLNTNNIDGTGNNL